MPTIHPRPRFFLLRVSPLRVSASICSLFPVPCSRSWLLMNGTGNISVRDTEGGAILAVKVVPGASRDRVVGPLGDALKVATSAPPEKGKANAAVAAILAKALGLDRRAVELAGGASSPRKEFLLRGLSAGEARRRLEAMP